MHGREPRGVVVVDVGTTNTKLILFDPDGMRVAEETMRSSHRTGPPYASLDPEPLVAFAAGVLPRFDAIHPVDAVAPSAHGSGLACLAADGRPALPIMDYEAEPPPEVTAGYAAVAPGFAEVFTPVYPRALTTALQLYWQETAFPDAFGRVAAILPWGQYIAYRLGGRAVSEVTALGAQSQLWDVAGNRFSSLARGRGWDRLFAPLAKAWEPVGALSPAFRGGHFRGAGRVLAGVHDSNANYLRYLAAGLGAFTLLSTGTWIIGFDTQAPIGALDPARDTVSNTDVFGRPVACFRFMGGREFEIVSDGAPAEAADEAVAARLIGRGTFALPSFTDAGGPMPGTGGRGRIEGPQPEGAGERASLAAAYCALMVSESLDAVGSKGAVLIDGPFAKNRAFLGLLAALRPAQRVLASRLRDGTAAGARLLALMGTEAKLPHVETALRPVEPLRIEGCAAYRQTWRSMSA